MNSLSTLGPNWTPGDGAIHPWVAADRSGKLAMFINNTLGRLPHILLQVHDIDRRMDEFCDYIYRDSLLYDKYLPYRPGQAILDYYSSVRFRGFESHDDVQEEINRRVGISLSDDETQAAFYGVFVFNAIEFAFWGKCLEVAISADGSERLRGGEYFRHLIPSQPSYIDQLPEALRMLVVVADDIDFDKTRLLLSEDIDKHFRRLAAKV